jgi:uncharacterized protein involved in exopolysaccharide biosynthesis
MKNSCNSTLLKSDNSDKKSVFLSDQISVIEILLTLWKQKLIITICVFFVTIIGIYYSYTIQNEYTTETKFVVKTSRNPGNSLSQIASLAGVSLGGGGATDPSEYLKDVLEDHVFISGLYKNKWNYKGDSLHLDKILKIIPDTTVPNWEHIYYMSKIETIRKKRYFHIIKDSRNGIITLTVNMPDALLSYEINRYIIDYLSRYLKNYLQSQAKEKRQFIEKRIEEVKSDLLRAENQLASFREKNMMSSSPMVVVEEMRLTRQVTINQEIYIQLQKQYEITKMEELDDQSLVQIIKNPDIPAWRSKPKRFQIVTISGFLGLLLGFSMALALNSVRLFISEIKKNNSMA